MAGRHGLYALELHRRFAARLSVAACEDAVQEVLVAAWRCGAGDGRSVAEFEAYVRKAARNAAVSELRARHGEGTVRRSFTAYDERVHDGADLEHPERRVLAAAEQAERREVMLAAYSRLPRIYRAAIHDRYALGLPVAQCAVRHGLSVTKFERRFTESVNRLRVILAHSRAPDCVRVRFELDVSRDRRAPTFADSHCEACMACRTYRFARGRGLLAGLPAPAIGLVDRILSWRPGMRSPEELGPALATATDTAAAAGGAGALGVSGAALAGLGSKAAVIGACSVIAGGACVYHGQAVLAALKPAAPVATAAAGGVTVTTAAQARATPITLSRATPVPRVRAQRSVSTPSPTPPPPPRSERPARAVTAPRPDARAEFPAPQTLSTAEPVTAAPAAASSPQPAATAAEEFTFETAETG